MRRSGMPIAMSETAWLTSGADMKPPIQPIAVPTSSATRPTGMLPGSFTSVKKPIRMIASTGRPIQAASHICAAGPHRDERDRDAGQGAQHRRARGELADVGADESADDDDDADHERPGQTGLPGLDRVLGGQVDRQHDDEDHDEHVRHARAVRQRGDVGAVLAARQPSRQERVVEVAQHQGHAERGQHGAQHVVGGQLDHADHQRGQRQDVDQDVEPEPEERVEVTAGPPGDLQLARRAAVRAR